MKPPDHPTGAPIGSELLDDAIAAEVVAGLHLSATSDGTTSAKCHDLLQAARAYLEVGLSVLPVVSGGAKRPALPERHDVLLAKRRATDAELASWFGPGKRVGLAVMSGSVSGGWTVLDFDDPDTFEPWLAIVEVVAPGLADKLVRVRTPRLSTSGNHGIHLGARVEGEPIRSGKLARDRSTGMAKIEIRGEGNYAVVPPTAGHCHESGRPWGYVTGYPTHGDPPQLSREEWNILDSVSRSFDEKPTPVGPTTKLRAQLNGDLRPGDEFSERGEIRPLLEANGGELVYARDGVEYWRRPGKQIGVSASLGYHKTDTGAPCLHMFSSSWPPFEDGRSYNPFAVYTHLRHGGDFAAAAKQLAREGYGAKRGGATSSHQDFTATRQDDIGNGQRFAKRNGQVCRYCHISKQWWVWNGKRWKPDEEGRSQVLAKETARGLLKEALGQPDDRREAFAKWAAKCQSGKCVREILRMAESELPVALDEFDTDPFLLNCANGVLDLDLSRNPFGELRPHDPALRLARFTPVEFLADQDISDSHWIRFLDQVVPDKEIQEFLQVFSGYSLTGITNERLFVLLYGRGRNGKSTFLDALRSVVGDYSRNAEFKTFLKKQHDQGVRNGLARLAGARLITAVEPPESSGSCFDESVLKIFTGGTDKVTAAEVYQKEFEYIPQGKLWLATNHEPDVKDTTDSFWDRIIKVPFTVRIDPIDRDLPAKLNREASVILSWAWQGVVKWQRDGFIRIPPALREATGSYRESTDPVQLWINDKCQVEQSVRDVPRALFADFRAYAIDAGLGGPSTETAFGRALTDKGFESKLASKGRYRIGLRLLTTPVQGDIKQQVQQVSASAENFSHEE